MYSMNLFILFIIYTRGSSRLCINTEAPFKRSYVGGLGTIISSFKRSIHYEEVEDHLCRLRIEIDYQQQELVIFLSKQYNHPRLIDAQVYFVTNIRSIGKENFTIINSVESACSEDQCEVEFIHYYLPWMINARYNDLKCSIILWIEQISNRSESCHVNNMEECAQHHCEIVANPDKNLFHAKPICLTNDTMKIRNLSITYDISNYLITHYDDLLALALLIDTYHYVDDLFITAGVFQRIDESAETKVELVNMFDLIKSLAQTTTTKKTSATAADYENESLFSTTTVTTSRNSTNLTSTFLSMNQSLTHQSSTDLSNITSFLSMNATVMISSAVQSRIYFSFIHLLFSMINSCDPF